jgi:hypothetical protein
MTRSAVAPKRAAPEVSVVIPCFNEEENVAAIAGAVAAELATLKADYEIIFIDTASTDDTVERVMALCAADTRIKLIANNRNYGQMRSPTHGIYQATGRSVIAMCADFQDPPALIGRFVTRWREGASIVLGVRASEKTSLGLGLARGLAYRFLGQFADYQVIPGATGFGIYDRRVVDTLAQWNEPEPFFRGMLVESGFPIEIIPYDSASLAGSPIASSASSPTIRSSPVRPDLASTTGALSTPSRNGTSPSPSSAACWSKAAFPSRSSPTTGRSAPPDGPRTILLPCSASPFPASPVHRGTCCACPSMPRRSCSVWRV